jgi:hypothetical protein
MRITQVSYGETTSKFYQAQKLELTATVEEGEDWQAVRRVLRRQVRKALGIGPSEDEVEAARKVLEDSD